MEDTDGWGKQKTHLTTCPSIVRSSTSRDSLDLTLWTEVMVQACKRYKLQSEERSHEFVLKGKRKKAEEEAWLDMMGVIKCKNVSSIQLGPWDTNFHILHIVMAFWLTRTRGITFCVGVCISVCTVSMCVCVWWELHLFGDLIWRKITPGVRLHGLWIAHPMDIYNYWDGCHPLWTGNNAWKI